MSILWQRSFLSRLVLATLLASVRALGAQATAPMEFTCATQGQHGTELTASTRYAETASGGKAAFGFDLVDSPAYLKDGACASDKPFFLSVAVPEGNYQVTVTLGAAQASTTTVRAESRRLMVEPRHLAAKASENVVFNVNVRTEDIAGAPVPDAKVKLKPREIGALDWDRKLTLEFNGEHPAFRSVKIRPIADVPTVYLAGDSTMVDQDKEPWAAWGQMLPAFFGDGIAIANEAESGESLSSFISERRFDKILSTIKRGDFLMIQFAHNDQKLGTPEGTDFKANLQHYVDAARKIGALPILVTSMNRRTFDPEGRITDSLGGYPQAMREVANEAKVPLIDLNAMSKTLYEAMGPEGTLKAFVHYPANTFPGQTAELKDDTHFNAYGAYELARAVVQAIHDQKLPLSAYLRTGIPPFNAARPDAPATVVWPLSPLVSTEKPYGK